MVDEIIEKYFDVALYMDATYVGHFRGNAEKLSRKLQDELARLDVYAAIEKVVDAYRITLIHIPPKKGKLWIHILLLLLTILTTLFAGALQQGQDPFKNPLSLFKGVPFSLSLMLILGLHEMGHYLASKRYGIKATLPYFLPVPHPLIGTMGAFIMIKSPITHKDALMEIGSMGPIVGFFVALPVSIIGISLSRIVPISHTAGHLKLGTPLIFQFLTYLIHGHIKSGYDIVLHPVAFAGWLGMFVSSLNLLPLGQLDGGHVSYALFGELHKKISKGAFIVLLFLGFFWPGWWLWAILLLLLGLYHPPLLNNVSGLSKRGMYIGILSIVIFLLTFVPVPFSV